MTLNDEMMMENSSLSAPLALGDDVPVGVDHVGAAEVAAARRVREVVAQVAVRQAVVRRDAVGVPVLRERNSESSVSEQRG